MGDAASNQKGGPPLRRTPRLRRLWVAAAVILLAAGGLAALPTKVLFGGVPADLDAPPLPLPQSGDRGEYRFDDASDEPGRLYARFAVLPDRLLPSPAGGRRPVAELDYNRTDPWVPGAPRPSTEGVGRFIFSTDPGTARLVAWASFVQGAESWQDESPIATPLVTEPRDIASNWSQRTVSILPEHSDAPLTPCCLLRNSLQGATGDQKGRLELAPAGADALGGLKFEVEATGLGSHGNVFVLRSSTIADATTVVRIWFDDRLAYPVRIEASDPDEPGQVVAVSLTGFDSGPSAPAASLAATQDSTGLQWAGRKPWGLDETGLSHPFPLSAAYGRALEDSDNPDFREFMAAHPRSVPQSATYTEAWLGASRHRSWTLRLTDGADSVTVCSVQFEKALLGDDLGPASGLGRVPAPAEYNSSLDCTEGEPTPAFDPALLPRELPTADSLLARWQDLVGSAEGGNSWGFDFRCADAACASLRLNFTAGFSRLVLTSESLPDPFKPARATLECHRSLLTVNEDGEPLVLEEAETVHSIQSGLGPAAPVPTRVSETSLTARVEDNAWSFPVGSAAATMGLLALLGALVYQYLSHHGSASLSSFYTRVTPAALARHPLRARLLSLVETRPGLHFRALALRLGIARGTARHHLEKLVAGELVTARPANGRVFYFMHGQIDRRVVGAVPFLKSRGAQRLFMAVADEPGVSPSSLARTLSLDPGTVSYHVKRLAAAGLVFADRTGREVSLRVTDVGREAWKALSP